MNTVTVLVLLAVGFVGADQNFELSSSQKLKARRYIMECMKQTNVKPEVLADAKKGNFKDDDALKKFTLCFFQKSGMVDHDGILNVDVALSKLPAGVDKANTKKLLEECKKKSGKDAADTAFEVFKCYFQDTKTFWRNLVQNK